MKIIDSIKNYFLGVYSEINKVTWPTKKQVINDTLVVIGAVIVVMIVFGMLDYGLSNLLKYVINTWG